MEVILTLCETNVFCICYRPRGVTETPVLRFHDPQGLRLWNFACLFLKSNDEVIHTKNNLFRSGVIKWRRFGHSGLWNTQKIYDDYLNGTNRFLLQSSISVQNFKYLSLVVGQILGPSPLPPPKKNCFVLFKNQPVRRVKGTYFGENQFWREFLSLENLETF